MSGVAYLAPHVGILVACAMLAVARASYGRSLVPRVASPRPAPPRTLSVQESGHVLAAMHEPRFVDLASAEVYATLLDEGGYLCSERTMYRIGPAKWAYFYLYVVLDVFSRYIVGWMVATEESAVLAKKLVAEICARQSIDPGQLTLHADRGSAMTSKPFALLLSDLGVTKTHSRPCVSNDNPFSEAAFKTLKYRPGFPDRFGCEQDASCHSDDFIDWYSHEHRHGALGLCTPYAVHYGLAAATLAPRHSPRRRVPRPS
ncbi:IS3 family transposase [soil metagenome]